MVQLRVSGLYEVSEKKLEEAFSLLGVVESVEVIRDSSSGKPVGFGVVRMADSTAGEAAIKQLNGTMLGSRRIRVSRMPTTMPGELGVREWLSEHAQEVMKKAGLKSGDIVLDYGCGPGIFTIAAARVVGSEGKVYALDLSQHALELVRDKADRARINNIETIFIHRPEQNTGLEDESLDAVLLYDVLHDVDNKHKLMQELHRVLRPEGLLSVFPMHMGTEKLQAMMREYGLFHFRDYCSPPGDKAASEVVNYIR